MPESTKDRPTTTIETIFMLTKSPRYFYDRTAVALPAAFAEQHSNKTTSWGTNRKHPNKANVDDYAFKGENHATMEGGMRSRRSSDWFFESWHGLLGDEEGNPLALVVNTKPYKGSHCAVFPDKLVEPLILSATSEKGCCVKCGTPWKRITDGWEPSCGCGIQETHPCLVFDPFAGSGTVLMAAKRLGRNYLGLELNENYGKLIQQRIDSLK